MLPVIRLDYHPFFTSTFKNAQPISGKQELNYTPIREIPHRMDMVMPEMDGMSLALALVVRSTLDGSVKE
jgi:hypothetical protein